LDHLRTEMSPGSNDAIIHATIFVVGAGRGPLVNASLRAIDAVNKANRIPLPHKNISHFKIKPRIVAVEKNPSAVLYLNSLKTHNPKWKVVEIVECDMREADQNPLLADIISGDPLGKTDIVVSELLGSFGCNELSPECLDGFQQSGLLKETGVSIPQR
jgi:protein arginine N-methyltransferase 5